MKDVGIIPKVASSIFEEMVIVLLCVLYVVMLCGNEVAI